MPAQLYVMPVIGTGTDADPRRPKYADTDLAGISWSAMDYGNEPIMVVVTESNPTLAAEVDVTTVPADLDSSPSAAAVSAIQTKLEAVNIPANWVTTSLTYRQIVRVVLGFFFFAQRIQGKFNGRLFPTGVTLSTTFSSLTSAQQNFLIQAAQDFGWDTSSLSGSSTVRQILIFAGQHFANTPIVTNLTVI